MLDEHEPSPYPAESLDYPDDNLSPEALEYSHEAAEEARALRLPEGAVPAPSSSEKILGPETAEEYFGRINSAADLLRINRGRSLSYGEQARIDNLVDGSGFSEDEAIEKVIPGGRYELDGDPQFNFSVETSDLASIAEKIIDAKYASEISHIMKEVVVLNKFRNDRGLRQYGEKDVDEISRLLRYKRTKLQK